MRAAWNKIPKKIDVEKEKKLREEPLEKGDFLSMLAAAFLTIFLPAALILLLLGGVCLLLFQLIL